MLTPDELVALPDAPHAGCVIEIVRDWRCERRYPRTGD